MSALLPAVKGISVLNASDAMNSDIISAIHAAFPQAVKQVKKFAPAFKTGNTYTTALNVWNFLKQKITYKKDSSQLQLVKMPNVLVHSSTGDCKSYSLFAASIMAALGYKVKFRYAGYDNSNIPTHVYTIVMDDAEEIIIDGVYSSFNDEKPPTHFKDYTMNVYTLSGISAPTTELYADKLKQLYSKLPDNTVARSLIAKEINRVTGEQLHTVYADNATIERYKKSLERIVKTTKHPNSLITRLAKDELNQINNGSNVVITGVGSLKSFFQKVGSGVKKGFQAVKTVALSPARSAFLGLVAINVHGMATRMSKADQSRLKETWEKLGGNWGTLSDVISKAKDKKAILGFDDSIGVLPAASALALAAPIIAALADFLKANNEKKAQESADKAYKDALASGATPIQAAIAAGRAKDEYLSEHGALVNKFDSLLGNVQNSFPGLANQIESGETAVSDNESGFKLNTKTSLMIGGGILAAMLILKRK
jgi:hypothetical protein